MCIQSKYIPEIITVAKSFTITISILLNFSLVGVLLTTMHNVGLHGLYGTTSRIAELNISQHIRRVARTPW